MYNIFFDYILTIYKNNATMKPRKTKGAIQMTAQEMIKKYNLVLVDDNTIRAYRKPTKAEIEMLKAAKPEVIKILRAEKEAEEKARAERKAKIAAIEGLAEILKARAEWDEYYYKREKAFESECGIFPAEPKVKINDLKAKYPRAAAYLKAEAYSNASNYRKAAAGQKAVERIINGEDHEVVIADMEAEWSNAAHEAVMWN